jgi:hypothetical protein
MERVFQICERCGAWRETTKAQHHLRPLGQVFVDYDHRFFLEEHFRCPYTPKSRKASYGISMLRESDRGFRLPDPAKEWKPEHCAQYKPRRRPSVKVRQPISERDLIGWWITNNFGGLQDEAWRFKANDSGIIVMLPIHDSQKFAFRWRLTSRCKVSLRLSGRGKSPVFLFFFEGTGTFKVTDEINEYGEKRTILTIQSDERVIRLSKRPDDFWEKYMERMKVFKANSPKIIRSVRRDLTRITRRKI